MYRATERYVFGWTDYRGMYSGSVKAKVKAVYDMSTDLLTNFMGTVIIMIPVSIVAYWIWSSFSWL